MVMSRRFLAVCFGCLLPLYIHAQAPVVDDSENFAMLDDEQAAAERPVAREKYDDSFRDEETALAQDNEPATESNSRRPENNDAELLNKIKGLQQEVQELRGQLDVQAHEMKALQQQQLSFYKDFDSRLRSSSNNSAKAEPPAELSIEQNISASAAAPRTQAKVPAPAAAATQIRTNPADEQIRYLAAYDLVKSKRFDEALVAMQDFTAKYPKGGYTANAQYWLGELYMVKKDYPQAIQHFEIVLKHFSSSSKAAACSLKIGYALAASGQEAEARHRLQDVIKNFPDTPTAQLASTKLKTLYAS